MSLRDLIIALAGHDPEVAIVLTDGDLKPPGPRVLYVNPAFERMTGYAAGEVLGGDLRILQGEGTSVAARKQLAKALRQGRRHRTTLTNYRKSGETYLCEIEVFPVLAPDGELIYAVALEREIERRPGRPRSRLT